MIDLSEVKDDTFHDLLPETAGVFFVRKIHYDDTIKFGDFTVFGKWELKEGVHQ